MGEVINIDFKNKNKNFQPRPSQSHPEKIEEQKNKSFDRYKITDKSTDGNFFTNREFCNYHNDKTREFKSGIIKIKSLPSSNSSLQLYKNIVDGYSDVELIDQLITSNEKDWVKKPSFYQAILDEIGSRRNGKRHEIV